MKTQTSLQHQHAPAHVHESEMSGRVSARVGDALDGAGLGSVTIEAVFAIGSRRRAGRVMQHIHGPHRRTRPPQRQQETITAFRGDYILEEQSPSISVGSDGRLPRSMEISQSEEGGFSSSSVCANRVLLSGTSGAIDVHSRRYKVGIRAAWNVGANRLW